jgi:hypothetical protein
MPVMHFFADLPVVRSTQQVISGLIFMYIRALGCYFIGLQKAVIGSHYFYFA